MPENPSVGSDDAKKSLKEDEKELAKRVMQRVWEMLAEDARRERERRG